MLSYEYSVAGEYKVKIIADETSCAFSAFNCSHSGITELDLSQCSSLRILYCDNNKIKSLDLSGCPALILLQCYNNQLPLLDLYNASQQIGSAANKNLGEQTLPKMTVQINTNPTVDFSAQIPDDTDFAITKDGVDAAWGTDYIITDGEITFLSTGNYIITMTNDSIVSHPTPANVIVEVEVEE